MQHTKWAWNSCDGNALHGWVGLGCPCLAFHPVNVGSQELPPGPATISDYALVRRQLHIFERAVNKFKSDVGLWVQYIEIAKREGARALVGRITARCGLHGYEGREADL